MNNFINQRKSLESTGGIYYLFMFLIWPFFAFLYALIDYNKVASKRVIYFFMVYIGLTFVISNAGSDGAEYARRLVNFSRLPFSDFFQMVGGMYTSDTSVDIVQPFLTFVVSRFTSDYYLLFAVFAAVFGYFYVKSINLLYDVVKSNKNWHTYVFLVFFIFVLPITAINGFRMWTAIWVFFYGAYHVILYKDTKYLFLTFGSCLVHFSMLSANAILLIYLFAGNRNIIYIPLVVASFILPSYLAPLFETVSQLIGGAMQTRYEMYSNEEYAMGRMESAQQAIWFVKLGDDLAMYYFLFAMLVVQYYHSRMMEKIEEQNVFSFSMLFLAFVNFGKVIPSFGGRFQVVFILFGTVYMLLYFVKLRQTKLYPLVVLGLFPMMLYAGLQFRNASDCLNAWIITPGLGVPLFFPGISLAEFLFN